MNLKNIPVNIITGFLGVGKTTAIQHLLKTKPADEKWAVLVNEFGKVGIDQTAFEEKDGVTIKELPGGCICCSLGLPLTMSLVMLLQRARPDRLLIEPTGIGHPAGIIDTLRKPPFDDTLDIRSTVCLVDPRSLDDPRTLSNEIFQDQINLADVLVINKTDIAESKLTEQLERKATEMFPPKDAVVRAVRGHFDPAFLDGVGANKQASFPASHTSHNHDNHSHPAHEDHTPQAHASDTDTASADSETILQPGRPLVETGSGYGRHSCGWRFHPDDIFDLDRLSLWCQSHRETERIKGAFRTGDNWVLINQVLGEQVVSPLAWRKDSRLEMIATERLDIETLTESLLTCLQDQGK